MTASLLPCVTLEPQGVHRGTVVWLHGLGADGNDFVPAVPHLGLGPAPGLRFVFPTAPAIPVTINGGMIMPAWYDLRDLDIASADRVDTQGLLDAVERVRALIERETAAGVSPDEIVVAGFSQGGAVALHLALTHPDRLAGLLLLSTYAPSPDTLERTRCTSNRDLPVFQAHGTRDPLVPVTAGRAARDLLRNLGHDVDWSEYPIAHEVSLPELEHAGTFLHRVLAF